MDKNTTKEVKRLARKYWHKDSELIFIEDVSHIIEKALAQQKKELTEAARDAINILSQRN